ncbi:hypothetical protein HYX13_02910 [Candidatus Woesearchaeota archaeon]|nr:hypothetical protein [Candidatus Woesearchaeota archaeon]
MEYLTISFYQYFSLDDPLEMKNKMQEICRKYQLTGRILIAKEGVNAAISGKKEDIMVFKKILCARDFCNGSFSEITFREQETQEMAHSKLTVKVRKEIVHFGKNVDLSKRGTFLKAEELQQWYRDNEQKKENSQSDFVLVDARNEYEWNVGKFKNAVTLPMKNFRDFSEQTKGLEKYKQKKVVLYCTGGIRCEKASAYLKENGFPQVYHIEGGIINYLNLVKEKSFWEGGLFVFDGRLVSETGKAITSCVHCGKASEKYQNCFNLRCDKLFVGCAECLQNMGNTCSKECEYAPKQRKVRKEQLKRELLGKVENYYAKNKVALVKVKKRIMNAQNITFFGKTTPEFTQQIIELRSEEGEEISSASEGELVTFFVQEKVRKGDRIEIVVTN